VVESPIADRESLNAVLAAPHAVAFLSVPWSGPERVARKAFLEAAQAMASEPCAPVVLWALLDEDAPAVLHWLESLGLPALSGDVPRGAGSILWLRAGMVVAFQISGQSLRPGDIIARTRSLWQAES
jgi:hypothetical protein